MINKFQTGGAAPQQGGILQEIAKLPQDKQKQIMAAFGKWAQAKGLNIQQLQGNEQALEQAMGQFLQEMQASQAPKARLGAKLNYVRKLKGDCPEGQEVVYFKSGGRVCKKCIEKGREGIQTGKDVVDNFKNRTKTETYKDIDGTGKNKIQRTITYREPTMKNDTTYNRTKHSEYGDNRLKYSSSNSNPNNNRDQYKKDEKDFARAKMWSKEEGGEIKKNCGGSTIKAFKKKCGGKTKKHLLGGIIGF